MELILIGGETRNETGQMHPRMNALIHGWGYNILDDKPPRMGCNNYRKKPQHLLRNQNIEGGGVRLSRSWGTLSRSGGIFS